MGNAHPLSTCCIRNSHKRKRLSSNSEESPLPKISKEQEIPCQQNIEKKERPPNNPEKTKTNEEEEEDELMNDPFFRYQKGDCLGIGPHGVVYESMEINDGHLYACKFVSCLKNSRKKIALYLDKKILDLCHINIVQYREVAESLSNEEDLMIVSEMVSGGPLSKLLMNFKVFDEKICKLFTKQILEALVYLHSKGYAHSNLKPNNVMIEASGLVKLNDFFTLSKQIIKQSSEHKSAAINNVCYVAPEILLHGKKTPKSDIWSMGCIILELLTGVKPWGDQYNNIDFIAKEVRKGNLPHIPENLSKTAQNFLKLTLEIDENKRPAASDLINDLFVLEINEKQENLGEIGRLETIKSLFISGEIGEKKEDNEFAMAKNAFYSKLYKKTVTKYDNNSEEKVSRKKSAMRESVLDVRKRNDEERKKYEQELMEMFKENDEL